MRSWILLAPLLAACAALRPGPTTYASPAREAASLRSQLAEVEARLRAAKMRRDTQATQNSAFPDQSEGEISYLEGQRADLELRLDAEERKAKGEGPTSVEEKP